VILIKQNCSLGDANFDLFEYFYRVYRPPSKLRVNYTVVVDHLFFSSPIKNTTQTLFQIAAELVLWWETLGTSLSPTMVN